MYLSMIFVIQIVFKELDFLAQTLITMYISFLIKASKINVNNVSKRNNYIIETTNGYLIEIFEDLETLLDHILDFIDATQITPHVVRNRLTGWKSEALLQLLVIIRESSFLLLFINAHWEDPIILRDATDSIYPLHLQHIIPSSYRAFSHT
jgi:hypothetical protein